MRILLASILAATSTAICQTIDYMPLSVGNHWTYSYLASEWYAVGDYTESFIGTASIDVIDSAANADTTWWTILEIRDVLYSIDYHFPGPDTSWNIRDTTEFIVLELSAGRHLIARTQPADNHWRSPVRFSEALPDTNPFYRYHDPTTGDTLRFSSQTTEYILNVSLLPHIGIVELNSSTTPQVTGSSRTTRHKLLQQELTGTSEVDPAPSSPVLLTSYPNPFNPITTIDFTGARGSRSVLTVVDVLGRRIAILFDGLMNSERQVVRWNAGQAPSGVYFAVLQNGGTTRAIKLLLAR